MRTLFPYTTLFRSNDGSDDEKPVHQVSLDAYYIDKYEVTVGQ
jgi:formylglycine-generating enzyme required for sulfatase activity